LLTPSLPCVFAIYSIYQHETSLLTVPSGVLTIEAAAEAFSDKPLK